MMRDVMARRYSRLPFCFAACLLAGPALAGGGQPAEPVAGQSAPRALLPPATIDDTLAITGEDIDARRLGTRMTVDVKVNGAGPYRFVVDSGADTSVVGQGIASALGLPATEPVLLNGITGSAMVARVKVDALQVGTQTVTDLEVPALAERYLGAQGMIGLDALVEQRLVMDFEKRTITIDDARRAPPRYANEIVVTARRRRGQLILTQARANGHSVDAVIDTGSEVTIGNMALRDALMRRGSGALTTTVITGVTGVDAVVQLAVVPQLKLGPIVLQNVPIAFADVPPFAVFGLSDRPALLLGTDLMANFRKVSLDFRARKVRFQLRRCDTVTPRLTMTVTRGARLFAEEDSPLACRR
jgi:predicted aspartyl protease